MSKAAAIVAGHREPSALQDSEIVTGKGLLIHTVPALRSASGRLDARAVCKLFGITLSALSRAIKRSEQTVHKTSDAPSIQSELRIFERIALLLLRLTGSQRGLRIWMNAPNPELEGSTPIELVLNGEGNVVTALLEAVSTGEPA